MTRIVGLLCLLVVATCAAAGASQTSLRIPARSWRGTTIRSLEPPRIAGIAAGGRVI